MPDEAGKVDKRLNIVTCKWCKARLLFLNLNRHFINECCALPQVDQELRFCTTCQDPKPLEEFAKKRSMSNGFGHTCLSCNRDRTNTWWASDRIRKKVLAVRPGRWILKPCPHCQQEFSVRQMIKHSRRCASDPKPHRLKMDFEPMQGMAEIQAKALSRKRSAWHLREVYGLTHEQYEAMLIDHKGLCAICKMPPRMKSRGERSLHIDHDHSTGVVRGLLCTRCNHLIGNCLESFGVLLSALDYLRKHKPAQLVS